MSGLHWFPFYWDEYSSKTMHLTQGQHGAYMLLLRWVYTTGKPIPAKQRYSIAQARLKQEISDTDAILAEFFEEKQGFWHNLKAEEVMAQAQEKHSKFVAAGRAGGLKRSSNALASLNPGPSNNNHNDTTEDISSLREDIGASRPKPRKRVPDDFPAQKDKDWALDLWLKRGRTDLAGGIDDQIAQFRDHHASHGKSMADWPAAWRTWARNALKFNGPGARSAPPPSNWKPLKVVST